MKNFKYTACAPPACSCPTIEVDEDVVYIHDDYGHVVQLTVEQMERLAEKFLDEVDADWMETHGR